MQNTARKCLQYVFTLTGVIRVSLPTRLYILYQQFRLCPPTHPERNSGQRSAHSVFWGKLAEQAFGELDIFRRKFYEPKFFHLLTRRKALEPLMVTSAPCDYQEASAKMCAWLHIPPLPKSYIYWPHATPTSPEQVLGPIKEAVSPK